MVIWVSTWGVILLIGLYFDIFLRNKGNNSKSKEGNYEK